MMSPMAADFAFLDHPFPLAIAHRGGGAEFPENSMAAFANAVSLGFVYLETDTRVTRDGRLIIFHDDTLDRATDRTGPVAERTWDELRSARLRDVEGRITDERIPLLEELFTSYPNARLNIDAKESRALAPLVELIVRTRSLDRVCLAAFSEERVAKLRTALGPELCTACGPKDVAKVRFARISRLFGRFGRPRGACLQIPIQRRVFGALAVPLADRKFVATAARYGLPVHVWTVNEAAEMTRLLDLGVGGLMTDAPTVLRDVLVARGEFPS